MPVIKNFSNAELCVAGLGSHLLRLCLKRNTSLLNSFFNGEGGKKEENFCFVSSLVFLVVVYWYAQQCYGITSSIVPLLSSFENRDVGLKYSAV